MATSGPSAAAQSAGGDDGWTDWRRRVVAHRRREHNVRAVERDRQLLDARRVVDEQRARPTGPAVGGAEDAAVLALMAEIALRGDDHHVRVARIHDDARNLLRLLEADVSPGRASISALVHAVALGHSTTRDQITGADVDRVAVRRGDFERANHLGVFDAVEDGPPGSAGVGCLPHTAGGQAEVERSRLADHAGDGGDAATAERTDIAPDKRGEQLWSDGCRRDGDGGGGDGGEGEGDSASSVHRGAGWDEVDGLIWGASVIKRSLTAEREPCLPSSILRQQTFRPT